jgi:hypothetical protein
MCSSPRIPCASCYLERVAAKRPVQPLHQTKRLGAPEQAQGVGEIGPSPSAPGRLPSQQPVVAVEPRNRLEVRPELVRSGDQLVDQRARAPSLLQLSSQRGRQ